MTTGIRYLPWCRRAGASITGIELVVAGRTVRVPVSHLGPGDVLEIDPRQILRRFPDPDSAGSLPNLFPYVELRSVDLPWQVTPFEPDDQGRLAPWLALVVRDATAESPLGRGANQRPVIEVPASELPRFDELHLWCHVQVTGELTQPATAQLDGATARIMAPRALEPKRRYIACLVPCFEAGRRAGLGEAVADARSTEPAWGVDGTVILPVYDHWYFTTSAAGDFETLGRRISPRKVVASEPPWRVDLSSVTGDNASSVSAFMTALVPLSWRDRWEGEPAVQAADRLRGWLDADSSSNVESPVLGPPLYGGRAAGSRSLDAGWLVDLNLDPRRRAAAALGAEVVRRNQEELVPEAWRQLGHVRRANRERDVVQLSAAVTARWRTKHLDVLGGRDLLAVTAGGAARIRDGQRSAKQTVKTSSVPEALLSPALRRLASVHARVTSSQRALALERVNARVVPIGQRPPTPAALATVARTRAILASQPTPPPRHPTPPRFPVIRLPFGLGRIALPWTPSPSSSYSPADVLSPAAMARRSAIEAGVRELRLRVPRTVTVARPRALQIDEVAGVLSNALADPAVRERRLALRMDTGDVVDSLSPTSPLLGEITVGTPIAEMLRAIDSRYLSAGVSIEPDSVGLMVPQAAFIEAVLAGANHEMMSELRWRGASVDAGATPLRRFFDVRGRQGAVATDIEPLDTWQHTTALGSHLRALGQSMIVFRGELIRRFADPIVFAARAVIVDGMRKPSADSAMHLEPTFRGFINADTLFVGLDRTPEQLRSESDHGWFVILAERPTGVRFGLDEANGAAPSLGTWNDLAWSHVAVAGGHLVAAERTPAPTSPSPYVWARDAAHMAAITLQRPVRFAFHARDLLPEET